MIENSFNERYVLEFIKIKLGFPYNIIEVDDDFILDSCITGQNILKQFSTFFPLEEIVTITRSNIIEGYNNRYHLPIEEEIINVKKVLPTDFDNLGVIDFQSYNPIMNAIDGLLNDVQKIPTTFKYIHLNSIEIYGSYFPSSFKIVCNCIHKRDLSTIPIGLQSKFITLALADLSSKLLAIRTKYNSINTPFGEINLSLDLLNTYIEDGKNLIENEFKSPSNLIKNGIGIIVC